MRLPWLPPELEGRDGPARTGQGAEKRTRKSWEPLGISSEGDVLSSFSTVAPPTIAPSHPDLFSPTAREKFWRNFGTGRKRRKNYSRASGTKGMEMKVTSRFPNQTVSLGLDSAGQAEEGGQTDRHLPGGLCFQKSSHTHQIMDDGGEECLIPINSQSVINIWACPL